MVARALVEEWLPCQQQWQQQEMEGRGVGGYPGLSGGNQGDTAAEDARGCSRDVRPSATCRRSERREQPGQAETAAEQTGSAPSPEVLFAGATGNAAGASSSSEPIPAPYIGVRGAAYSGVDGVRGRRAGRAPGTEQPSSSRIDSAADSARAPSLRKAPQAAIGSSSSARSTATASRASYGDSTHVVATAAGERRQCSQCGLYGAHGTLLVCGGCMGAKYCSAECQRAHWRGHKAECRRLQLEMHATAEGVGAG
jgi:hypothetical protein